MYKRISLFFSVILFIVPCVFAQLQSPDEFLGYKIGSRYTPHYRLIEYYRHVAASVPSMMKLQQYGQTYEGRPLMVAYISNASNISNLENIRINNLRLAQQADDKTGGTIANAPAIVWLSYNVHGNETSSSEASLLTLYSLVDPADTRTKQWLNNTVVVIDPCLNPDGRDRYVNWFHSVSGKKYNPQLDGREHREPWPGGRTNHYNFDLNRDWAWQTQIESQHRIKLYNQWLPHIHVDFHEQGVNQPYYFAPAAQPYHEVITKWQRDFQTVIGRNHARYFDEQGWLYFTREIFDLLYPSYGDTYPTYNGSIGMTYEQAGGPAGGAAAITDEGDTLTLLDRATHHFTTSLSTLEVASQNAQKLVSEFGNYYKTAVSGGVGEYKSYIIKNDSRDAEKVNALLNLLRKNNIKFGSGRATTLRGFNYDNGKNESFNITATDIIIPSVQSRSALVKVLFEPNTLVVDSATYDITAWSLPYAYGVKAYASNQPIAISSSDIIPAAINNPAAAPYGYAFHWNSVASAKFLSQLMQKGIKLRFTENAFDVGGQSFERGAIVILRTSNQFLPNLWETVRQLANTNNVQLTALSTGFVEKGYDFGSSKVLPLKNRKLALLTGEGVSANAAGEIWHFFDQALDYPITLINLNDIGRMDWKSYDVIIMPDGNYRFLNDKASADQFRSWISGGGNVVALESAVTQLSKMEWSAIKSKKDDSSDARIAYEALRKYENRERDFIPTITPGSIFRVELDNTHPLAFGYPNYYYTLKQDDNIFEFIKEGGWNVGVLKKNRQVAGFVGSKLSRRLQDGLLFGTQEMGRGSITYLVDNLMFRSFWENGKLMFCNAVFLVGQ
ncbi:MAG: M14 metallopeptidase family protein [Chitinophagaceae bacterium]